jgi:uncharacterized protein YggE
MHRVMAVLMAGFVCWAVQAGVADAQQQTAETPTLAAAGEGSAALRPDQARLYVRVGRVRSTSRAARTVTNRQVSRVQRTLRAHGVPAADVTTVGVSVSRERVRRHGRSPRIRYRATAELDVLSRDVRHLGGLVDALADAGADAVSGPEFSFGDPSRGTMLATRAALADARRRADDAAARLGLRITGIRSVDLAPLQSGAYEESAGSGAGGSSPTRISPGRQEFRATVRVVYTVAGT